MEIFAVLSDTAFGMHEIDPYNTGISNMEYALNFSSCLFMLATAMSIINGCLTYFNLTLLAMHIS